MSLYYETVNTYLGLESNLLNNTRERSSFNAGHRISAHDFNNSYREVGMQRGVLGINIHDPEAHNNSGSWL